jgi:hypothetical protein
MKTLITVELTDAQDKQLTDWMNNLPPAYTGAIGGRFEYIINPTGVGLIIKVRDAVTKSEIDLTDYRDW